METALRIGDQIIIDCAQQGIWRAEHFIPLTARTYRLLRCFVEHPHQIMPIPHLLQVGWPNEIRAPADLYAHIYRLRLALEQDPHHPVLLITRREAGYLFTITPRPCVPLCGQVESAHQITYR